MSKKIVTKLKENWRGSILGLLTVAIPAFIVYGSSSVDKHIDDKHEIAIQHTDKEVAVLRKHNDSQDKIMERNLKLIDRMEKRFYRHTERGK